MAKLLKIVSRIIGGIFEWTLVILIFFAFAIRTSPFQTFLAEIATDFLSKELKTELRIDKVDIYFYDRVALDGVFVRDQNGDTLASLGSIEVVLGSLDLTGNKVTLNTIALKQGRVGINRDSLTGDYNYFFITDYFDSGGPKKTKKEPVALTIKALDIEHVDITYDDFRKSYNESGMDYDHLGFKNTVLHANNLSINGNNFEFDLQHLSTIEKCGLVLRRLKTHAIVGDKGILLSNLKINTSKTKIYASRFNLEMTGLKDIYSFEDSVTFNAIIDSSTIHLGDIAQFAPALKGMYQSIALEATLTQKVKDLKITDFDLRTGKNTIVRGSILLPDFRSLEGSFLKENLTYAYVDLKDLQALRLPDRVEEKFISLAPMIDRLGYFEVKRLSVVGYWSQFVLSSKQISTQLGTVRLDNGLLFSSLKEGGYAFEQSANSNYDVYIDSFQLGKFIDDPLFGKVNGSLFLNGVVGQKDIIRLNKMSGIIANCGFNNYNYSNIVVTEGSFIDNIFDAKVNIDDPHLQLAFDGSIDLNDGQKFNFMIDIPSADPGQLNFTQNDSTHLVTSFTADVYGHNLSDYQGVVQLNEFSYVEANKEIAIPELRLEVTRGATDVFVVTSNVANVRVEGKIDPNVIASSLNNTFAEPLSSYIPFKPLPKRARDNNYFTLTLDVLKAEEVLSVFAPDLYIAPGTHLEMQYDAVKKQESVDLHSGEVVYNNIIVRDVQLTQSLQDGNVQANVDLGYLEFNDSLYINAVSADIAGADNAFTTAIKWNEGMENPAAFNLKTTFAGNEEIDVLLKPSFFTVKGQTWDIMNTAELNYTKERIVIDHLMLERDAQFIAINGVLSDSEEDQINININDLHLNEFSSFIKSDIDLQGTVNGKVMIATPFTAFRANGDISVMELVINQEPIGDVAVEGTWNAGEERVEMQGDLKYLKNETFDFSGSYYPYKKENNIDFKLDFREMDLQFANAFMDPKVVSDIHGQLKGEIRLTGNIDSPTIDGRLNLNNGNVKVGLLGANFKLNGPIEFDGAENAFFINNMPIRDEEGNRASLNGQIFHTNFEKWNCDLGFNMDDRFLVMNTTYQEDQIYYGRAYVTGTANIFVAEDLTEIAVDVRTERGTAINLPMYGNSEIEEYDFITFEKIGGQNSGNTKPKIDFTGVDLSLNFDITPDAKVKLIFNEKTGDEIAVTGDGELDIHLNNVNDVTLNGQYFVKEGTYNFVLGPVKQTFKISEGGSITWTGDPLNANLDLKTYNVVMANFKDIGLDDVVSGAPSVNQEILCVLELTQTLNDPLINLDIQAPKATESGKAILNRIRSDKDELQKQFFSLLVLKKFAPIGGGTTVGGGGVADVITNQINGFLDQFSEEVKVNVAYGGDASGNQSYVVGAQKAFGEKQNIIIKGSFGVANTTTGESQTQSNLIGDMSLEYLINEDGTFRVNIFNESNEMSVIQDRTQGLFTQGVGLHYQEDFNKVEDFQMIQYFLNLFRKDKKVKTTNKRKKVPVEQVPEDPTKVAPPPAQPAVKPEEIEPAGSEENP